MSCGFTKIDLQNIIQIIDVCTKRGAFQAEELSGVGQLYDKLKNTLKQTSSQTSESVENVTQSVGNCKLEDCKLEDCKLEDCKDGVCPISNCGT